MDVNGNRWLTQCGSVDSVH